MTRPDTPQPLDDHDQILALMSHAFKCFNRGDMDGFRATWSDRVAAIINEAPPYLWSGQRTVEDWLEANARLAHAAGIEKLSIALDDCIKLDVADDHAHLTLRVIVSASLGGSEFHRSGWQISSLERSPSGWKVAALAYGSDPSGES